MKKILIITHYFPPRPGVGSIRPEGLAKYLPNFNWQPIVLTTTLPSSADKRYRVVETLYAKDFSYYIKKVFGLDPQLRLDQQTKPVVIKTGKNSFLSKSMEFIYGILNYPDEMKGWVPYAVTAGREIIKKEKVNAIISSSHPVTCHIIAQTLKKSYSIPWIADLRDLWTQNPYYQYGSFRKYFERRLERKIFSSADALVTTSEPWAEQLRRIHRVKHIYSIVSGFDPEIMNDSKVTEDFTITHTGRFYDGKRDPSLLFKALRDLIDAKLIDFHSIRVRFWGSTNHWLEKEIKRFNLEGVVKQYGMVSREESLRHQRESQILLLLSWNNPEEVGTYTGKIFEYLASKRPILAIGPEGVISDLLKETRAGEQALDVGMLKEILLRYYDDFKKSKAVIYYGDMNRILKYSQVEMAKKFAELLAKIS